MKMNKYIVYPALVFMALLFMMNVMNAGVPQVISMQGRLLDANDKAMADGQYQAIIRLYGSPEGGRLYWQEDELLNIKNGIFSTMLGEQVPIVFPDTLTSIWASVQIGDGAELSPRMRIGSVPFSFRAVKSDTASYSEYSELSLHAVRSDTAGYTQRADTAAYALSGVLPVGVIIPFGGLAARIPDGWMLCDGSALSSRDYPQLYQMISTSWGDGTSDTTGTKNFNLPDLRGVFLRGVDGGAGRDADASFRQAINPGGSTGDNVGSLQDMNGANSSPLYTAAENSGVNPMNDNQGYRFSPTSESVEQISRSSVPPNAGVYYIIKVR